MYATITTTTFRQTSFTNREQQIMIELMKGKLNKEIAYDLGISINTVKKHIKMLYKKTVAKNRIEFVLYAINEQRA